MLKYKSMLYCENCKRYSYIESFLANDCLTFKINNMKNEYDEFEILPSSLSSNSLQCKCNSCGSYSVANIDAPIAETVLALNELGFHTAFSCAGHNPNENSYITFVNKFTDKQVEQLTTRQRLELCACYAKLINLDDFKKIKNMTSFRYQYFEYNIEEFITKDLSEDDGTLSINFMYLDDENIDPENIDLDDYVECRRLFLKFLKAIVCILQFTDIIKKTTDKI